MIVPVSFPPSCLRFPISCADLPYLPALAPTCEVAGDRARKSPRRYVCSSFVCLQVLCPIRYRPWFRLWLRSPCRNRLNSPGLGRACPATAQPVALFASPRYVAPLRPRRARTTNSLYFEFLISCASCVLGQRSRVRGSLSTPVLLRTVASVHRGHYYLMPMWAAHSAQQCVPFISSPRYCSPHSVSTSYCSQYYFRLVHSSRPNQAREW